VNLTRRFRFYFSITSLLNYKSRSHIYRALLKYGYSKFSLEILEYCSPDEALKREQYYFDLLKPEYNILKKAGSNLGRKHSTESIEKMKLSKKIKNNSSFGTAAICKPVELTDILTNTVTLYPSILAAELSINASQGSLNKALKSKSGLYKKRYKINLV
jgi:hypothetical protein